MCANWSQTRSLNMAAQGSTSTTSPEAVSRKPVGLFIHALTEITQKVPTTPATPWEEHQQVNWGVMRPQPYR